MSHSTARRPTGRSFKEYRTKTPNSGPYGLVADADGNIWFTANFAGYIGKLDPKTGAIIEYRLPDDARDPHTPVFDQMGRLWFTVQGADMIGRLVPKTGRGAHQRRKLQRLTFITRARMTLSTRSGVTKQTTSPYTRAER